MILTLVVGVTRMFDVADETVLTPESLPLVDHGVEFERRPFARYRRRHLAGDEARGRELLDQVRERLARRTPGVATREQDRVVGHRGRRLGVEHRLDGVRPRYGICLLYTSRCV